MDPKEKQPAKQVIVRQAGDQEIDICLNAIPEKEYLEIRQRIDIKKRMLDKLISSEKC